MDIKSRFLEEVKYCRDIQQWKYISESIGMSMYIREVDKKDQTDLLEIYCNTVIGNHFTSDKTIVRILVESEPRCFPRCFVKPGKWKIINGGLLESFVSIESKCPNIRMTVWTMELDKPPQ